jgi:hypothetical protein
MTRFVTVAVCYTAESMAEQDAGDTRDQAACSMRTRAMRFLSISEMTKRRLP